MKLVLIFLFLAPYVASSQGVEYTIRGEFKLLHPAKKLYVISERNIDTLDFPANGILDYKGSRTRPGSIVVALDSPASKRRFDVWVQQGSVVFSCVEAMEYNKPKLVMDIVEAAADTKLFHLMLSPRTIRVPAGLSKTEKDSLWRQWVYNSGYRVIDSIFTLRPSSPVLPHYIYFFKDQLGREVVSDLYYRLPEAVQKSPDAKELLLYLQRSNLLQKGTTMEDFSMPTHDGKVFQLSAHNAKYTLLDFWASWCGPCRAQHPELARVFNNYKTKGFTIVGVSLDNNKSSWLAAIKTDKLEWTNISDLQGRQSALARRYRISPLPFSVLLDSNKRVVAAGISPLKLEEFLREHLD